MKPVQLISLLFVLCAALGAQARSADGVEHITSSRYRIKGPAEMEGAAIRQDLENRDYVDIKCTLHHSSRDGIYVSRCQGVSRAIMCASLHDALQSISSEDLRANWQRFGCTSRDTASQQPRTRLTNVEN